jgi:hypothetical protein
VWPGFRCGGKGHGRRGDNREHDQPICGIDDALAHVDRFARQYRDMFDAAVTENFFRENSGHADAANVPLKLRPRRCNRQITDKTQQDRELFFRTRSLGEV